MAVPKSRLQVVIGTCALFCAAIIITLIDTIRSQAGFFAFFYLLLFAALWSTFVRPSTIKRTKVTFALISVVVWTILLCIAYPKPSETIGLVFDDGLGNIRGGWMVVPFLYKAHCLQDKCEEGTTINGYDVAISCRIKSVDPVMIHSRLGGEHYQNLHRVLQETVETYSLDTSIGAMEERARRAIADAGLAEVVYPPVIEIMPIPNQNPRVGDFLFDQKDRS